MKKLLLVLVSLGIAAFTGRAELAITASGGQPAAGKALVEVRRDETGKQSNWRLFYVSSGSDKGRRDVGQVFVVPGKEGDSVTVNALSLVVADIPIGEDAPGAEISLAIHDYSTGILASTPTLEETGYLPNVLSGKDHLLFKFNPVKLEAGKRYAFILSFQAPAPKRTINFETAPKRAYPDGAGLFYGLNAKVGKVTYFEMEGNLVFTLYTPQE